MCCPSYAGTELEVRGKRQGERGGDSGKRVGSGCKRVIEKRTQNFDD